jgi:hypothetical protein
LKNIMEVLQRIRGRRERESKQINKDKSGLMTVHEKCEGDIATTRKNIYHSASSSHHLSQTVPAAHQ